MKLIKFFTCRNVIKISGPDGKRFVTLRLSNEEYRIISMAADIGGQTVEEFMIEILTSLVDDQK